MTSWAIHNRTNAVPQPDTGVRASEDQKGEVVSLTAADSSKHNTDQDIAAVSSRPVAKLEAARRRRASAGGHPGQNWGGGVIRQKVAQRKAPSPLLARNFETSTPGFHRLRSRRGENFMATRGRKPIPTRQSMLLQEPRQHGGGDLDPPAEVSADPVACQIWGETIAALRAVGTVHWADSSIVARYAVMKALWIACIEDARANGTTLRTKTGYEATRPSIATACKLGPQLLQIEAHLGLTPRGRTRLRATPQDEPTELEKFLAEKPF